MFPVNWSTNLYTLSWSSGLNHEYKPQQRRSNTRVQIQWAKLNISITVPCCSLFIHLHFMDLVDGCVNGFIGVKPGYRDCLDCAGLRLPLPNFFCKKQKKPKMNYRWKKSLMLNQQVERSTIKIGSNFGRRHSGTEIKIVFVESTQFNL